MDTVPRWAAGVLALGSALACGQPALQNQFWFERPLSMRLDSLAPEALAETDTSSVDCTPQPESWRLVPAERQLPAQRGESVVWWSPGKLHLDDPSTVRLQLDEKELPAWKEGRTLRERSFLYSPGGFLQAGLYLALPSGENPASLALRCRRQAPRWSVISTELRRQGFLEPAPLVGLERMGSDARLALVLPADSRLTLGPLPGEEAGPVTLSLACRQPSEETLFELDDGESRLEVAVDEADRWQRIEIQTEAGDVRVSRRGKDSDQCFVADPMRLVATRRPAPGMLLIIVDGLRHDVAADSEVMPNLVVRAQSASVFSQARVTAPWTRPSVTSMLTGLAPHEHGLESEAHRLRLAAEVPILPAVLRQHGYATATFSANPWLGPDLGLDRGFGRLMTIRADAEHVLYETRRWIEAQRGPWFAVVFLMDTHYPFHHRPDFDRTSSIEAEPLDVGDGKVSSNYHRDPHTDIPDAAVEKTRGLYLENAARTDEQLRAFFTLMGNTAEDAFIVITADHGEAFGEHDDFFHGWNLYDELLRVPLIVDTPGRRDVTVVDAVSLSQLASTFAGFAGINDSSLSGGPLPLNRFEADSVAGPVFASTRFRDIELDAVVWKRWKMIATPRRDHCQLYDLTTDPAESRNLCGGDLEMQKTLGRLLDGQRSGGVVRPQIDNGSNAAAGDLESLGYLSQ